MVMEKLAKESNTSDGNSGKKRKFSVDDEETEDDSKHSDDIDLLPSCIGALTRVTALLAEPSTSSEKHIPDIQSHSYAMTQLHGMSGEMVHGVKRKFLGSHYETKRRKRLKTYHYKTKVQSVGKRSHTASYNPEQDCKRLKTIPVNEQAEGLVSRNLCETEIGNTLDDRNTASSLDAADKSDKTSPSSGVEDEDADEVQLCPNFCVCRVGHSDLPPPVERKFDTPAPLYKACLLRRIYSLNNTQYMCCRKRCVTKLSRERVLKQCLFHMNEDYYNNDLRMQQYSWGEWKE